MKVPLTYKRTATPSVVVSGIEWYEYEFEPGVSVHWIGNVQGDITVGAMDPSTQWAGQWYGNIFESKVTYGSHATKVSAGSPWSEYYPDRDAAMEATFAEYTRRGGK